jgi:hypothetical protein
MDFYNSWGVHEVGSSWVTLLEAGQLISSTGSIDPVSSTIAYNRIESSPWNGQDGTTKSCTGQVNSTTSQVGWIGVFYNSENNHLTITDFAVANLSDMMVAGQTGGRCSRTRRNMPGNSPAHWILYCISQASRAEAQQSDGRLNYFHQGMC